MKYLINNLNLSLISYTWISTPVLIKKVDPQLYSSFKARAIERGLKIDEAFAEAITLWLQLPKQKTSRERIQEKNELAYRLLKGTLEKEYLNKWIVIADGKLLLSSETREELFEKLKEVKNDEEPALVFQVGSQPRRMTLGFRRIQR